MANSKKSKKRKIQPKTQTRNTVATGLIIGAMAFMSFAVVGGLFVGMFLLGIMDYRHVPEKKVEQQSTSKIIPLRPIGRKKHRVNE